MRIDERMRNVVMSGFEERGGSELLGVGNGEEKDIEYQGQGGRYEGEEGMRWEGELTSRDTSEAGGVEAPAECGRR